ncbi:ATP-dependent DNA helicase [Rippkaea orientalis PCC 8801]|uniref:ATP-dependent DNA helicase n=1 Tax=Rippkaea orientalis (strain PCC 8801 / RF-1) TaxID=41431 RepID=B7K2D9_RIPO1|nr:helicase C-terminal domain-containing protein [Rippkaea orientalis]ACK65275.1 ATP-dependent DNA helicase [Rippkaea orientalis PCC 8801]
MKLLEAEVHTSLRAFLRQQGQPLWDHHLTMARLVSRGLRLGRSAVIQTGTTVSRYGLSYLMPALLSDRPVLLVASPAVQQHLLKEVIPQLEEWLQTDKLIQTENNGLINANFQGILMVSPQTWLDNCLQHQDRFPLNITTLIDGADQLESWTRDYLTVTIQSDYWQQLQGRYPSSGNLIQEVYLFLKKTIFSHPNNPYQCCLLNEEEYNSLYHLGSVIKDDFLLQQFWHCLQQEDQLLWASIEQNKQDFSIHISPLEVASVLNPIWQRSPVVLMGGFLDSDKTALTYRDTIGLTDDILCLKFSPNRQNELIKLYILDRLPMPNTPEFQGVMFNHVHRLVELCSHQSQLIIIVVDDVPLKAQVGTILAAEFGSRVQVEKTTIANNGILICGWDFWQQHHEKLPIPKLLIMVTLPIPSLENPLVAARVTYYKKRHKDWFRFYLLPTGLRTIQQAVMPLRESQGVVALLDNRVNYRSYGNRILTALEPYAKINYIDVSWFEE